jgi:ubiquinone/menaquinone biosynthesis C-methylase UbiE
MAVALAAGLPAAPAQEAHGRLFPPENLGLLEGPDREDWQQPDRVMDELGIADGARVADLGAGGGWFTVRLAHRVGPNGRVFAQDIQPQMLESIRRRVMREGLDNVETILGTPEDPRLPDNLSAILIVDVYPQMAAPIDTLRHIRRALSPQGRLGIIDFKTDGGGGPGPPIESRLDPAVIVRNAAQAGLRLVRAETFLRYQYLLVFGVSP